MLNKKTHVYCTKCVYFDITNYLEDKPLPEQCVLGCNPYNPEDSCAYEERSNYVAVSCDEN